VAILPLCLYRRTSQLLAIAVLGAVSTAPALAEPLPSPVTPELEVAAKADGRVIFYASMDIEVAEGIGRTFEAKYPGIVVQVERAGAERLLQRVSQEYAAGIHTVDVIDSTDAAHPLYWKQQGWLAPYVPEGVARLPANARDVDGFYAVDRATMAVVAYNTKLVTAAEAPKSYADLLDPKWAGKIIKANPAYAGNTLTATLILSRTLGWDYFQKLGRQRVMQVQSATEPPKKLALGERAVMFDGSEYVALSAKRRGQPIEIVYMPEGTPLVFGSAAIMKDAPHPNAARLFISFLFSREGQQYFVEKGYFRSLDPEVPAPAGQPPLSGIKGLTTEPADIEKNAADVKSRYAAYFGL
jgi:iron(III) transport system substrate-binding protein